MGAGRPCLLVGESGTAKTVTLSRYLASLDPAAVAVLGLNFSSRTSSLDVQRAVEDCVVKRTKVRAGAGAAAWRLRWLLGEPPAAWTAGCSV